MLSRLPIFPPGASWFPGCFPQLGEVLSFLLATVFKVQVNGLSSTPRLTPVLQGPSSIVQSIQEGGQL